MSSATALTALTVPTALTALSFWTWASIVILMVGPVAVFLWFLRDAVALITSLSRDGEENLEQETRNTEC